MKKTISSIIIGMLVFQMTAMFIVPISSNEIDLEKNVEFENFVLDEIIIKFKDGISKDTIRSINSINGLSVISESSQSGFHRLNVPNGKTVSEIVEKLSNNPFIVYVEPNYIAKIAMTPNDPYFSLQWHMLSIADGGINVQPAWDIATGSGVTVAVIDTGISTAGNDLTSTCFVSGYDFVNNDNDPTDDNGHGTHVAGTIAQSTNNGIGVCGVAFNACLMPVKVLNSGGTGTYADMIDGINYATNNGADIMSISIEGSVPSQGLEDALENAYINGVTVVAASGNSGQNGVAYPAAYDDYVIAVGATRYDKTRSYYSNYGSSLDLVAPGGDVTVDQNGDGWADGVLQETFDPDWAYHFWQGTSMATPHVSGLAALLYSNGVSTPDNIRNAMQNTAVDLGSTGWDMYYGYGLIDAYAALTYNSNIPPTCTLTANPNSGEAPLTTDFSMTASDSDGTINSWELDIDNDGTAEYNGSGNPPASQLHTYSSSGTYIAELTVWDDDGATGTDTNTITVTEPNIPPGAPSNLLVQHYGFVSVQDAATSFSKSYSEPTTNDYTATYNSDNFYHIISEDNRVQGGSGKAALDITYDIPISSGTTAPYTIYIESYKVDNDDSYTVSYTVNGGSGESNIITISTSESVLSYQISGVSAGDTVIINIKDSSMNPKENIGTIYIDHLYIESGGSGGSTDDNKLTWDASLDDGTGVDDVTNYNIYRSDVNGEPWNYIGFVIADDSITYSYIDSGKGTADNTQWWYIVRAEDSGGLESANSNSAQEPSMQNDPPYIPSNPTPTDSATGVSIITDLSWTGGDPDSGDTVEYDVYFGTSTTPPYVTTITSETYNPGTLIYETTYYWQIIARDNHGAETAGPIWSFTTETEPQNNPPYTPSNPSPANTLTGVNINADLSWTGGDPDGDTVTYDVYFGTTNPPSIVSSGQSGTTYDPGTMEFKTLYYWYIVSWDEHGASTTGPTWSFTTETESVGVTIESISPNYMQIGTTISVTITGSGFEAGADVTFENGAGPNPTTSNIVVVDSGTITYDVYAKSGGPPKPRIWDVRVTNSDSSTGVLVDGFTVNP